LTETSEKYFKKRKTLFSKKFVPAKKIKFTILHFNIFRKRKNGGKKEKTDVSIFYILFSQKSKQNYINDLTL
jgi:hypothetical protein